MDVLVPGLRRRSRQAGSIFLSAQPSCTSLAAFWLRLCVVGGLVKCAVGVQGQPGRTLNPCVSPQTMSGVSRMGAGIGHEFRENVTGQKPEQ